MTEQATTYKTKRPSNNPEGRPVELKDGQYLKFYADAETIRLIKLMIKRQKAKNQSDAIRQAVKAYIPF